MMGTYPPRVRRDRGVDPRATLAARWLDEPQQISNRQVGLELSPLPGVVDPGDLRLRPRVFGRVEIWKDC